MILEKIKVFFQETQILNVLRNFAIPVTFNANFATIWWKKFHVQKRDRTSFNVNANG